jgi:hypothetical protein
MASFYPPAGGISDADQTKLDETFPLAQAPDLVDGDQTITPGSSKKSQYVLRAGVATADMSITLGNTGGISAHAPSIIILAQAHNVAIKNAAGGTMYTVAAGDAIVFGPYFTSGSWVPNTLNFV